MCSRCTSEVSRAKRGQQYCWSLRRTNEERKILAPNIGSKFIQLNIQKYSKTHTHYMSIYNSHGKYIYIYMYAQYIVNDRSVHAKHILKERYIYIIIVIIINVKDWTLWSVPSPKLQLLSPKFLRSSNCSLSLWSVVAWFQRDSVLWHSLQVSKPVPSVFIYLV